jgi:ketosteroid isomerase-like protein
MDNEKEFVRELTDVLARVLYYQDTGEPDWMKMDFESIKRHYYGPLPKEIINRYMNDAKFYAQVHRAVAMVVDLKRNFPNDRSNN